MLEIQQNISKKKKEVNSSCARCQAGVAGQLVDGRVLQRAASGLINCISLAAKSKVLYCCHQV